MSIDSVVNYVLIPLIKIGIVFGILSGCIAYLTLLERKVIAWMQVRMGPMRVGPRGLLQPIADGIKLMLKEDMIPAFIVFAVIPAGAKTIHIPAFNVPGTNWTYAGTTTGLFITDLNIGVLYV